MTRKQLGSALDRFLGGSTTHSIIAELQSSIVRMRTPHVRSRQLPARPIRDFVDTLTRRHQSEAMLKRVRVAIAKSSRTR